MHWKAGFRLCYLWDVAGPAPVMSIADQEARMKYRCPGCQRVLYNRRLKQCGFCGAQIPESLRFTPEEIAAIEKKIAELEVQRIQRERAADEEKKRKQAEDHGGYFSGIT